MLCCVSAGRSRRRKRWSWATPSLYNRRACIHELRLLLLNILLNILYIHSADMYPGVVIYVLMRYTRFSHTRTPYLHTLLPHTTAWLDVMDLQNKSDTMIFFYTFFLASWIDACIYSSIFRIKTAWLLNRFILRIIDYFTSWLLTCSSITRRYP